MAGMDHAPPPFFKRGPAPLALLTFYIALSLAIFVVDLRFQSLELLRQSVALFVDPVQRIAQTPGSLVDYADQYLEGMRSLSKENDELRHAKLTTAPDLQRLAQLEAENERLRKLLSVKEREKAKGQVAQILYTARDPFSRKVIVDKGQQANIVAGQPAIDESGVVGQVTRVFPFSSEITLITDKDQAVPVQIVRNGQRSVVFGLGNGQLATQRGLHCNEDDRIRRAVIQALICQFRLGFDEIEQRFAIDFRSYFSAIWPQLQQMARDGLIELDEHGIDVRPAGRLLVRSLCMLFDHYLEQQNQQRFSRVI